MPYIKPQLRTEIENVLGPLLEHLKSLPVEKQDGALNYTVTRILKELYAKGDYFTYNRSMGTLSAIQSEWYRRAIVPYEDEKIQENGDVQ